LFNERNPPIMALKSFYLFEEFRVCSDKLIEAHVGPYICLKTLASVR
jgi:hypothetical protein